MSVQGRKCHLAFVAILGGTWPHIVITFATTKADAEQHFGGSVLRGDGPG